MTSVRARGYDGAEKEQWMNSKAYCWYCKKDMDCECMDTTCWVCGRPYAKDRCKEFGFDNEGEKVMTDKEKETQEKAKENSVRKVLETFYHNATEWTKSEVDQDEIKDALFDLKREMPTAEEIEVILDKTGCNYTMEASAIIYNLIMRRFE